MEIRIQKAFIDLIHWIMDYSAERVDFYNLKYLDFYNLKYCLIFVMLNI